MNDKTYYDEATMTKVHEALENAGLDVNKRTEAVNCMQAAGILFRERVPQKDDEERCCEPVGDLLDSIGVTHHPESGELVSDAIVLMKVIDPEGDASIRVAFNPGMSWIERIGLLRTAEVMETNDVKSRNAQ